MVVKICVPAGESVRLKLQTPLFVADALLAAGAEQLAADLTAVQQVSILIYRAISLLNQFLAADLATVQQIFVSDLDLNPF